MTERPTIEDSDAHAWSGVVLALDETPSGRAAYRVKLWHAQDPERTVCLLETFDNAEILAEWTRWAVHFGLPKFIEREPGRIEGAERRLAFQAPSLRRRGATIANRRPRILRRRFVPLIPAILAG